MFMAPQIGPDSEISRHNLIKERKEQKRAQRALQSSPAAHNAASKNLADNSNAKPQNLADADNSGAASKSLAGADNKDFTPPQEQGKLARIKAAIRKLFK